VKLSKNYNLEHFLVCRDYPEMLRGVHIPSHKKWKLLLLALILVQRIHDLVGPLTITKGFVTPELNKQLKGKPQNQHLYGEAVDYTIVKDGKIDYEAMETSLAYVKSTLSPAVGECVEHRDPEGRLFMVHLSLPDHRRCGVFSVRRYRNDG